MRKSRVLASLVGASAMVVWARLGNADTSLWTTQADFGGSTYAPNPPPAGQPQQTNWEGFGNYVSGRGVVDPTDTYGNPITYSATSLGASPVVNGLGNLDNKGLNSLTPPNTDANYGMGWAGLQGNTGTPSGGSMTLQDYQGASEQFNDGVNMGGGYDPITSGELITVPTGQSTPSAASMALLNNLANSTTIAIDYTAPGGGTTLTADGLNSSPYYILEFGINNSQYNGSQYVTGWANQSMTAAAKDTGAYGDDPGSFVVTHGTGPSSYYTAYIPYDYSEINNSANTYMQLSIILNADGYVGGNVTFSNIRTVSPTWAAGSGSWNTVGVLTGASTNATSGAVTGGTLTTQGNWIGAGSNGLGAPDGSGQSATFGDLDQDSAAAGTGFNVTLDSTQTLGTLNFNTLDYQYTLGVGTAGALVMDNTVNGAPAQINDIAGGNASTPAPYTQQLAVPITLNSNTIITVSRSTDTLQIGGSFSPTVTGTGNVTVAGSGTLLLYGPNTYGSTTVNAGATLIAGSDAALPNNQALINNGKTTAAGNETLASLTGTGTLTVGNGSESNIVKLAKNSGLATQGGLVVAANSALDLTNNHMIITFTGADPMSTIYGYLKSGFNGGNWNGPGIISSAAATENTTVGALKYGIGFSDGNDKIAGHSIVTGLSSGQIELKYTLLGDANLDGTVNGSDFSILAANFGQGYSNWDQGNFLYTPAVNGTDFGALAANFGQGDSGADTTVSAADVAALNAFAAANGLPAPTIGVVPEPASVGLVALAGLATLSRRRARRGAGIS